MREPLTLGIPKGSLEESTLALFKRAGFSFYGSNERVLWLSSNDPEIIPVLLRPQEIPLYVADGRLDAGLSGLDWIAENNCVDKVRRLADLCYSKRSFRPVRWVLAVANDSPFESVDDLRRAGRRLHITTELMNITQNWLAERGVIADVSFSWGATEAKVPVFFDALVDATETGSSLRANGLRIIETLFESTTILFANRELYRENEEKRRKLDAISLMLRSCLAADTKVRISVQAPREDLANLRAIVPADATVSVWDGLDGRVLLDVIVDKDLSRSLLPQFVQNGVQNVSVAPLAMLYEADAVPG